MRFLDRLHPLALITLRVVLGVIMVAHGSQKVFGGVGQITGMVSKLGFPAWMGYLVAATEFGGGILLIAGLLTRLAALAVCIEMVVAVLKVHLPNGLKGAGPGKPGYEFPLACAAIAFSLLFLGAGPISLDWVFFRGGGGASRK